MEQPAAHFPLPVLGR